MYARAVQVRSPQVNGKLKHGENCVQDSGESCERKGRKARLMEIDVQYVDCIVQQWEQYTGQAAVLEGDGRCFTEISQERLKKAARSKTTGRLLYRRCG